jgi:Reverse transcriptase (RNA-dependent DNA polymerase)
VLSDIYAAADKQCLSLLGLLDLSAAFDCVDHAILINRLQKVFGINDTALKWITSFLSDRSHQISYSGRLSATVSLLFDVPQGSVLGPQLYLLYTYELFEIISR